MIHQTLKMVCLAENTMLPRPISTPLGQAQSGPDWARTSDPALIKRMLKPTELQALEKRFIDGIERERL